MLADPEPMDWRWPLRSLTPRPTRWQSRFNGLTALDIAYKNQPVKDCMIELKRLEERLNKFIKSATDARNSFATAQLQKTQVLLTRLRWMVDPPPLPTNPPPQVPDEQGQQVNEGPEQPGEQLPPEQLSNSELADRTLQKSETLISALTRNSSG